MRQLWVLMLVLPALAGCLGDEGDESEHDHSEHEHGEDLMSENVTVENLPPQVTIVIREGDNITLLESSDDGAEGADNGTSEPSGNETEPSGNQTSGSGNETAQGNATADGNATAEQEPAGPTYKVTIPINVTFDITFDDPEGDDINWTLDVNGDGEADSQGTAIADNGTYLPFNFTTSYTDAGNFTVTLTANDGGGDIVAGLLVWAEEAVEEAAEEAESALEDRGWYEYDPATNLCHVKEYDDYGGTIYVSSLGGGLWVLAETNGVSGLQVSNGGHPGGANFDPSAGDDCIDGDLVVV